jgi:hypothetical protein
MAHHARRLSELTTEHTSVLLTKFITELITTLSTEPTTEHMGMQSTGLITEPIAVHITVHITEHIGI